MGFDHLAGYLTDHIGGHTKGFQAFGQSRNESFQTLKLDLFDGLRCPGSGFCRIARRRAVVLFPSKHSADDLIAQFGPSTLAKCFESRLSILKGHAWWKNVRGDRLFDAFDAALDRHSASTRPRSSSGIL